MHGSRSEFLPTAPYQCQLVRGRPHLGPTIAPQQQGDEYQQHQDDIASHAAPPLIVCAVPSADREGGQPCADVISSFPAPQNALSGSTRVPGTVGPRGRPWARSAEAVSQGARGEFGGAGRPQGDATRNIKGLCLWWGNAAPCMKYSHLYIFYTSLKQARIKNIRLHFGLPFKILLNYNILAVLSSFGTSIAIRKTTASKIPGTT